MKVKANTGLFFVEILALLFCLPFVLLILPFACLSLVWEWLAEKVSGL